MKSLFVLLSAVLIFSYGCAPAVIGGGAAGGYKVATEERTVGRMMDDATISTKVKTSLIGDSSVKARHIDVDVINGNVILTGVVDSDAEARQAVKIAKGVNGVVGVTNNLQVGEKTIGQMFDDKVIVSKINGKLVAEPGIRTLNIDVDSDRGVVTLSGIVDSMYNKNKIIDLAKSTAGVVKIIDNLKISK